MKKYTIAYQIRYSEHRVHGTTISAKNAKKALKKLKKRLRSKSARLAWLTVMEITKKKK